MSAIRSFLREEIQKSGPMSFSRFMEAALYHPDWGYYSQREKTEDYYTSVDVHPLFAELLALYLKRQWKEMFSGKKFQVIELGAGSGALAGKILDACGKDPDFYGCIRYTAVETSALRREAARAVTSRHPAFQILPDFDFSNGSIEGVILSNEFFDALPVNRVAMKDSALAEIFLDADLDANLKERLMDPSSETREYFDWLRVRPAEGCRAEAHPAARRWMEKIAAALKRGLALSIDYGLTAPELYSEMRPEGTLLCHYRHQTNRDFYDRIGAQDLTAHVNFTALIKAGEEQGLRLKSLQTQSRFFLDNGIEEMANAVNRETDPKARFKASAALKSLIHPEGMGGTFKVLVQEK